MQFVRLSVLLVSLVEVPFWLLKNRRLFRNPVVYLFSTWSFGHTVSGLDFCARLYHPRRISLVYVPHARSNPYLPSLFGESMEVFTFESVIAPKTTEIDAPRLRILRAWLRVLARMRRGVTFTELDIVYGTAPLTSAQLSGTDEEGTKRVPALNYTGYLRVLRDNAGVAPRLPERLRERAARAITDRHADFFERPFATLLLREKGVGMAFDNASRSVGEQANYRAAVEQLVARGYRVVGSGETNASVFSDIAGYYDLSGAELPAALLNVFLVSECALFVGQQSGPFVLPDSRRIPCVICDAFPYRLGTFRSDDLVLFKPLLDTAGRHLSLVEAYRDHPHLAYGIRAAGFELGASSAEDILAAVEETLERIDGTLQLTDDDETLVEAFRALAPSDMPLHYHGNRPPLAVLRRERDSLLR